MCFIILFVLTEGTPTYVDTKQSNKLYKRYDSILLDIFFYIEFIIINANNIQDNVKFLQSTMVRFCSCY